MLIGTEGRAGIMARPQSPSTSLLPPLLTCMFHMVSHDATCSCPMCCVFYVYIPIFRACFMFYSVFYVHDACFTCVLCFCSVCLCILCACSTCVSLPSMFLLCLCYVFHKHVSHVFLSGIVHAQLCCVDMFLVVCSMCVPCS